MSANTPSLTPTCGADGPAKVGALAERVLDRRTNAWRRRCEIAEAFTEALGGRAALDDILAAKVSIAAELAVVAELTRIAFMQGVGSADDVVRTARAASLAERRLGISERREKPRPTLADYLASKAA